MATKKASTPKATEETKAVKKTVTRRKRTKAVEEPVVIESAVEITTEAPAVEETTQDSSSVQQQGPVIARPTYFTGSIDELNAAIQQAAQQNQSGFDNGLQNPALGIQQQQPVQTTIQFPVTPVMETKVVNPAAMGSEQKAALEQQIQQSQPITKKEEENKMTKQETIDKTNETKMDQQAAKEESVISAALANKIADKIAEENKKDDSNKLFDAVIEGMLVGTAAGVGVVAGSYAADKAITAFEEWRNNKDKAEEATKLVSGLL